MPGRSGNDLRTGPVTLTASAMPDWQRRSVELASGLDLAAYRDAVGDVVEEVAGNSTPADVDKMDRILTARLVEPELVAVLREVPGGARRFTQGLVHDVRNYRPSTRSSASDLPSLVRICLLSQIDSLWWGGAPSFETDDAVQSATDLVDLDPLRSRGKLGFCYRRQPEGLPGRARDFAQRRVMPGRRPHTAGLRFTRARLEAVALLNQLAREIRVEVPKPPLWVTSAVRSVQHQHRLRALGYAAVLPSAHCVGYAVDIEMRWFLRFDTKGALPHLLLEHRDAGEVNVIDEGQAWHVCISPAACAPLAAAYRAELGDR